MKLQTYIQPQVKCVTEVDTEFMSNLSNYNIGDNGEGNVTGPIEDVDPGDIIITTKEDNLWDDAWE